MLSVYTWTQYDDDRAWSGSIFERDRLPSPFAQRRQSRSRNSIAIMVDNGQNYTTLLGYYTWLELKYSYDKNFVAQDVWQTYEHIYRESVCIFAYKKFWQNNTLVLGVHVTDGRPHMFRKWRLQVMQSPKGRESFSAPSSCFHAKKPIATEKFNCNHDGNLTTFLGHYTQLEGKYSDMWKLCCMWHDKNMNIYVRGSVFIF